MGGPRRCGQLDLGSVERSGGCKKNLRASDLLEALKQLLDKLHNQLGRSQRWLAGLFTGIVATILSWLRRPPSGKRPGRPQLNVTEAELAASLNYIETYPFMGSKKGVANLVHHEEAWLGAGSYDAIRGELTQHIGEELKSRRSGRPEPEPFEPPVATGLGQVWGTDLFEVMAWDVRFDICDFLDIFNQEYLALQATEHAADSEFVAACFELACEEQGGRAPTVCTKTDRGSQFYGHFAVALKGRTDHVRIPPGCPWYNGESERGHRDCRALLYTVISTMPRPRKGEELAAMQEACDRVRRLLNEVISKPSLGNVTPREVADGVADEVRERNRQFVERQREARKQRKDADPRPLGDRVRALVDLTKWSTQQLVRFLNLKNRDYTTMTR